MLTLKEAELVASSARRQGISKLTKKPLFELRAQQKWLADRIITRNFCSLQLLQKPRSPGPEGFENKRFQTKILNISKFITLII